MARPDAADVLFDRWLYIESSSRSIHKPSCGASWEEKGISKCLFTMKSKIRQLKYLPMGLENLTPFNMSMPFTSPFTLVYNHVMLSKLLNFTGRGWGRSRSFINLAAWNNNCALQTRFYYLVKSLKCAESSSDDILLKN